MDMWMQHFEMTMGLGAGSTLRTEVGDYVNLFWPNLARWSGMLWDPKRFPTMSYDLSKQGESNMKEFFKRLPWHVKLYLKLFLPNNFSKVKGMRARRMRENCESFAMNSEEPSCFFTTGFLNGFFSAVKNQHVKETRCIAMGDPYCEWEFR